jgi:putative ABC transport system ATP-binding protein
MKRRSRHKEGPPLDSGGIELIGVSKTYLRGSQEVHALSEISAHIDPGEFVVLLGPSGSGKTTMLNLIGAIEPLTAGRIDVAGTDVASMTGRELTAYRRNMVGFVFQFFNLVPTLTATENVEVIAELTGPGANERSESALAMVGLADRGDHFPAQLSGGEQQRVAIARALVKEAPVLLADEPTGSLDLETGKEILGLLRQTTVSGHTVVLVTHNSAIADLADRIILLRDGRIVDDRAVRSPIRIDEVKW